MIGDYILAVALGLAFQYFAIAPMRGLSFRKGIAAAAKADILSLTAFEVGLFGWMTLMAFVFFPNPHLMPSSPVFRFLMQLGMIVGYFTSWPANAWLIRRGIKEGPHALERSCHQPFVSLPAASVQGCVGTSSAWRPTWSSGSSRNQSATRLGARGARPPLDVGKQCPETFRVTPACVPRSPTLRPETRNGSEQRELRKHRSPELFPYPTSAGHEIEPRDKDRDNPSGELPPLPTRGPVSTSRSPRGPPASRTTTS
ncbi:MAG: Membrane protein [Blastococcus sp.]|nr:Membrane protein [Blastococcus sp.]